MELMLHMTVHNQSLRPLIIQLQIGQASAVSVDLA